MEVGRDRGKRRTDLLVLTALDADERLEDAGAAALGALPGLREFLGVEDESALFAAGGRDDDPLAGSTRRPDGMTQVLFHVSAAKAELARERRGGARRGEHLSKLSPKRHVLREEPHAPLDDAVDRWQAHGNESRQADRQRDGRHLGEGETSRIRSRFGE